MFIATYKNVKNSKYECQNKSIRCILSFQIVPLALEQVFQTCPGTAYFVCLPDPTHLIQLTSSLVQTARLELGVSDKGDIQNVLYWGSGSKTLSDLNDLSELNGSVS